jgi:hypothetical protein
MADEHIERPETKVDGLATRIDRVDGDEKALTKGTREGFRELRAQVKLPRAESDRRLTTLETGRGELRDRAGRLEVKSAS